MSEFLSGAGLAVWLGILTSISPCPLATNITAVSYIGRKVERPRLVLLGGLLYTAGRTLAYIALAALLAKSLLSAPRVSFFLQTHMLRLTGPLLIVVGMFLTGLLRIGASGPDMSERVTSRADRMGIWGAGLLGFAFALSFCPTSAALFFGSLLPLTVNTGSVLALPLLYGVGTALPVVVFAVIIATGAHRIAAAFGRVRQFDLWARWITGAVFIGAGIFITLRYIFNVV